MAMYLKKPRWEQQRHGVVKITKYVLGVPLEEWEVDPYQVVRREGVASVYGRMSEKEQQEFLAKLKEMVNEKEGESKHAKDHRG